MVVGRSTAPVGATGAAIDVRGQSDVGVKGFSLAVGHDPSRLVLREIHPGPLFKDAELISSLVDNEGSEETAPFGGLFVVLDFQEPFDRLPVDLSECTVLGTFVYDVAGGAEPGLTGLDLVTLRFGRPRIAAIFVNGENREIQPTLTSGAISITPPAPVFLRGNCNRDGGVDTSDAISILLFLFGAEPSPDCEDACDTNDDGDLDISDAIYLLLYEFTGGPAPPPPFSAPDADPTPDALDCEN